MQKFRATPEKFIAYVAEHPLRGLDTARRAVIIEEAAGLLNGLNTNQRREVTDLVVGTRALPTIHASDERRFSNREEWPNRRLRSIDKFLVGSIESLRISRTADKDPDQRPVLRGAVGPLR